MSAVDDAIAGIQRWWETALRMNRGQVGLRALLALLGIAGFGVLHQPWASTAGVLTVLGLICLLVTVVLPDSAAPVTVLAILIAEWLLVYGLHGSPPVLRTVLLAADLYLLHSVAALCAAMPSAARLDRQLLVRWSASIGLTLVASAVVIGIGYAAGTLPGSLTLELIGLAGAVIVVVVPVWLVRGRR